jgi:hypothetical protein
MKVSELNKAAEVAAGQLVTKATQRLSKTERLMLAAADKYEPAAPANWATAPDSVSEALDAIAAAYPVGSAGEVGAAKTVSALYDFSVNGGAVGARDLGVAIPDNAVILEVVSDILTQVAGGGTATLEVGAVALSPDLVGDSVGVYSHSGLPLKITTPGNLELQVATGAVTAGKVRFFVRYVISE